MTTEPVVIVGVGMMTAVGLSASETATSVRSGTARFGESRIQDKHAVPFTLAEVPEEGLPELSDAVLSIPGLTSRERRMLRLATIPLRECVAVLAGRRVRVGLCLALPERETTKPLDRAAFLAHLAAQVGGDVFDPQASDSSHVGRAGGLTAIGQAVLTIQSGQAEFMIAGGVDTYRDPYVLGTLDLEARVKSDVNSDGFVPGEGAGFLLMASSRAAATHGLAGLARVSPLATGFELGHLYSTDPYQGAGLAATLSQLVALGVLEAPVGDVYSSMTGESHWAKEWGVAFLRTKAAFREDHGMHHPADCFGDTGAASGPLMVGLAALGIKGNYRRSPVLAYGSSDRGPRAAVVVST
jgi:3-oxoacyl-[acyl-carrier-protein] synthase-1